MSWSPGFIAALAAGGPMTWRVRTILLGSEATFNDTYTMTSGVAIGEEDPILAPGGPSIQGSTMNIDSWSATLGGMSFPLSGDLTRFRQNITRGTAVEVFLSIGGYLERVNIGRVTQVSSRKGVVTMDISDALALLDARSIATGDQFSLFYDVGSTTTLTADYAVADGTVNVTATSAFGRETGGTGAIQIGDFYLSYTGSSSTTFTGVSPAGQFWTTAATATTGDTVTEVALLKGHPLDIAMRLITSTGAGTNGGYDDYPASWGYGLTNGIIDVSDIEAERDNVMTANYGAHTVSVVVSEPQDAPRTWMLGWLAAMGVVPVLRQGSLSFRAFSTQVGKTRGTVLTITDAMIDPSVGISSQWFNSQTPVEYATTVVYAQSAPFGSTGSEPCNTLPAAVEKRYDMQAILYDNVGGVVEDVYNRLYKAAKRIGEVLTLPLSGMEAWQVCPGDIVLVKSSAAGLRMSYAGLGRDCWVLEVQPDPRAFRVTLKVVSFPSEDPF